jgi:hypothetical protein
MRSFSNRSDPFFLDVVRGKIPGVMSRFGFGYNASVSTETNLWDEGGIYVYPVTAIYMTVSSTSDNDTESGTGARTFFIEGLGEGYVEQTEVIALNGKAGRTTTKKWLRIFRITVLTGGTVDGAEGSIYIGAGVLTQGVPDIVYSRMCGSCNMSHNGFFTVPAGHTAYVSHTRYTVGAGKEAIIKARVKPENGVWVVASLFPVYQNSLIDEIIPPYEILEKSDVDVLVSAQTPVEISTDMRWYLFEN